MHDYLIHSDNGLDGPELVDVANTLDEARVIARRELARDPQRFVTIIDRWDCPHPVDA